MPAESQVNAVNDDQVRGRQIRATVRAVDPSIADLRICEESDSVSLHVEAEHRMTIVALRVHQHRLAQPPPDLPKEAAEHIKSLLALQLPQIDVEVDFIGGTETEDRQHIGRQPDPQVRTLGIRRTGQHALRPGHRKHRLSLGVLALPALLRNKIENRLPVLHRGIRNTHVWQRPHQVRVEEAAHVIPQQISHSAMLPGSQTQRTPVSLAKDIGAPPQVHLPWWIPTGSHLDDSAALVEHRLSTSISTVQAAVGLNVAEIRHHGRSRQPSTERPSTAQGP